MPDADPLKLRDRLIKRLDPYWKMEAANAAIVPLFVIWATGGRIGWITLAALVPVVLLLVIGAVYWRSKVRQLRGEQRDLAPLLRRIGWWKRPSLLLTATGGAAALGGWLMPDWSVGLADRIAASSCALLAALEYVNYYHRQLQHFDNWADFKRLLKGQGFRRSSLAADLEQLG